MVSDLVVNCAQFAWQPVSSNSQNPPPCLNSRPSCRGKSRDAGAGNAGESQLRDETPPPNYLRRGSAVAVARIERSIPMRYPPPPLWSVWERQCCISLSPRGYFIWIHKSKFQMPRVNLGNGSPFRRWTAPVPNSLPDHSIFPAGAVQWCAHHGRVQVASRASTGPSSAHASAEPVQRSGSRAMASEQILAPSWGSRRGGGKATVRRCRIKTFS